MRSPLKILAALLSTFATVASAGANYSACIDATDPPACIARMALTDGRPTPGDVTNAIIRHGLVELIPSHSAVLVRVVKDEIASEIALLQAMGVPIVKDPDRQTARAADSKMILAAVALLTAARHQANPFADPMVQSLTARASNHPLIPFIALLFWLDHLEEGNPSILRVDFAGLPEIWRRVKANREVAPEVVYELAMGAINHVRAREETQDLLRWYASRPNSSASRKAQIASVFARLFSLADEAERLMMSGGDSAPDYDIDDIHAEIATVRLMSRYDAKDARLVADEISDDFSRIEAALFMGEDPRRVALEKSGAKAELREIAAKHLRLAQADQGIADAGDLYASASDCYRRAGDRDKALETAREGLPGVEKAFRARAAEGSRQRQAAQAQGRGTAPVVALYRAGAIEEALKFGYLSGEDRFDNAELAGEPRNPQWILDDGWPLYISVMAQLTLVRGAPAWRRQVFDAMSKWCAAQSSQCDEERVAELAALAASVGEEAQMKMHLGARAKKLETNAADPSAAVDLAAHWAHALGYLKASP